MTQTTANSRSGRERGVGGEQGAEGLTVVTGIHNREEVGGGFVMGAGLFGDPVHAQAVAQASEHAHKKHGARFAHPAQVVEVADIETLMSSAGSGSPRIWRWICRRVCSSFSGSMPAIRRQKVGCLGEG